MVPPSRQAYNARRAAARQSLRHQLGDMCSSCGKTPEPVWQLRYGRDGHRFCKRWVQVCQLEAHHLEAPSKADRFRYLGRATNGVTAADKSGHLDSGMPSLVLLCMRCHKQLHSGIS
jgi:hypothetical protein